MPSWNVLDTHLHTHSHVGVCVLMYVCMFSHLRYWSYCFFPISYELLHSHIPQFSYHRGFQKFMSKVGLLNITFPVKVR